MTNAISGIGAGLFRNDPNVDTVYRKVGEVNSIDGPSPTADTIDVSSFDSTSGYREFIAGFKDTGEITAEMNFTNATYKQALADFNSGDLLNYRIEVEDTVNSYIEFSAVNVGVSLAVPTDDKVSSTITLKGSGAIVFGDDSV